MLSAVCAAEELGVRALPVLRGLAPLLHHEDPAVRGRMIEVVLATSNTADAEVVAEALSLARDEDPRIRRSALRMAARLHPEVLAAAKPHVADPALSRLVARRLATPRRSPDRGSSR